jgi:hypothetical protein
LLHFQRLKNATQTFEKQRISGFEEFRALFRFSQSSPIQTISICYVAFPIVAKMIYAELSNSDFEVLPDKNAAD